MNGIRKLLARFGLPERPTALLLSFIVVSVLVAKAVADRLVQEEPWNTIVGLALFIVFVVAYKATKRHLVKNGPSS